MGLVCLVFCFAFLFFFLLLQKEHIVAYLGLHLALDVKHVLTRKHPVGDYLTYPGAGVGRPCSAGQDHCNF